MGFERDRRPEALSLDLDFAENGALEEARKVQSEHWSTDSDTLFIEVAQFLDVGAEVTVDGEASGEARAAGTHWARVRHALQRRGLHVVAVQWYERLAESGDGERREFVELMVDIVNSTELRMADAREQVIGIFQPLKRPMTTMRAPSGRSMATTKQMPLLGAWCRLPVVLGAVVCVFPIQKLRGANIHSSRIKQKQNNAIKTKSALPRRR